MSDSSNKPTSGFVKFTPSDFRLRLAMLYSPFNRLL